MNVVYSLSKLSLIYSPHCVDAILCALWEQRPPQRMSSLFLS